MAINIQKKENYLLLISDLFSPNTERRYKASELTYSGLVTGSTLYNFKYRNLLVVEMTGIDFTEFLNDGVAFADQAAFEAFMDIETASKGSGGGGAVIDVGYPRWINIDNLAASSTHTFVGTGNEVLLLVGDRNNNPSTTLPYQSNIEVGCGDFDAVNNMINVQSCDFDSIIDARISVKDGDGAGNQKVKAGIRIIFDKASYILLPVVDVNFIDIMSAEVTIPNADIASIPERAYHKGLEAVQIVASGTVAESLEFNGVLLEIMDRATVSAP